MRPVKPDLAIIFIDRFAEMGNKRAVRGDKAAAGVAGQPVYR